MNKYIVMYHLGYAGPRSSNPAKRMKKLYNTISEACKARDHLFNSRSSGRWPVTEAYICSAIKDVDSRWVAFCRLDLAVRMR